MRNFPSDQAEAQFDYEVLEEDDEDITEQSMYPGCHWNFVLLTYSSNILDMVFVH